MTKLGPTYIRSQHVKGLTIYQLFDLHNRSITCLMLYQNTNYIELWTKEKNQSKQTQTIGLVCAMMPPPPLPRKTKLKCPFGIRHGTTTICTSETYLKHRSHKDSVMYDIHQSCSKYHTHWLVNWAIDYRQTKYCNIYFPRRVLYGFPLLRLPQGPGLRKPVSWLTSEHSFWFVGGCATYEWFHH